MMDGWMEGTDDRWMDRYRSCNERIEYQNQHNLCLSKNHHDFKKLKDFFKNVCVRAKPSGCKKQICDLQEFSGEYKFNMYLMDDE